MEPYNSDTLDLCLLIFNFIILPRLRVTNKLKIEIYESFINFINFLMILQRGTLIKSFQSYQKVRKTWVH